MDIEEFLKKYDNKEEFESWEATELLLTYPTEDDLSVDFDPTFETTEIKRVVNVNGRYFRLWIQLRELELDDVLDEPYEVFKKEVHYPEEVIVKPARTKTIFVE
jgi:hypothetical protein